MVYIIMSVWQQEARLYTLLANKNLQETDVGTSVIAEGYNLSGT